MNSYIKKTFLISFLLAFAFEVRAQKPKCTDRDAMEIINTINALKSSGKKSKTYEPGQAQEDLEEVKEKDKESSEKIDAAREGMLEGNSVDTLQNISDAQKNMSETLTDRAEKIREAEKRLREKCPVLAGEGGKYDNFLKKVENEDVSKLEKEAEAYNRGSKNTGKRAQEFSSSKDHGFKDGEAAEGGETPEGEAQEIAEAANKTEPPKSIDQLRQEQGYEPGEMPGEVLSKEEMEVQALAQEAEAQQNPGRDDIDNARSLLGTNQEMSPEDKALESLKEMGVPERSMIKSEDLASKEASSLDGGLSDDKLNEMLEKGGNRMLASKELREAGGGESPHAKTPFSEETGGGESSHAKTPHTNETGSGEGANKESNLGTIDEQTRAVAREHNPQQGDNIDTMRKMVENGPTSAPMPEEQAVVQAKADIEVAQELGIRGEATATVNADFAQAQQEAQNSIELAEAAASIEGVLNHNPDGQTAWIPPYDPHKRKVGKEPETVTPMVVLSSELPKPGDVDSRGFPLYHENEGRGLSWYGGQFDGKTTRYGNVYDKDKAPVGYVAVKGKKVPVYEAASNKWPENTVVYSEPQPDRSGNVGEPVAFVVRDTGSAHFTVDCSEACNDYSGFGMAPGKFWVVGTSNGRYLPNRRSSDGKAYYASKSKRALASFRD